MDETSRDKKYCEALKISNLEEIWILPNKYNIKTKGRAFKG